MSDLRFAVMGTGKIARKVAPLIDAADGCTVTCAASRDADRARAFADDLGFAQACTYEDLLKSDDIDAVYVTLPNVDHPRWSERLLDAGKHVLCEKPLAWKRADAERLFDAASRNKKLLVEAFMYLHAEETRRATEIAQDSAGPIGKLERIEASFDICISDGRTSNVRYAADLAGGSMMDLGCYSLSWARTVTGEELGDFEASCEVVDLHEGGGGGVDGSCRVWGEFDSGVSFELTCSMIKEGPRHGRLIGSDGVVDVPWFMKPDGLTVGPRSNEEIEPEAIDRTQDESLYAKQAASFARAVAGTGDPLPTAAWSIEQAGAIERIYERLGVSFPDAWDR